MPVRSETNASERPSGAHTGLMFFPAPMWGRTSTDPDSRWYRATRKLPICSWPKSVSGPRSVANAMVLPSGDQDGCRSAYLSLVRRRRFVPSTLTVKRSDSPPSYPVNTSWLPSGDHAGVVSPFKATWMRRTSRPRRAVVLRQLRQVGRLNGVPPFVGQLVEAQAQRAVEGVLDSGGRGRLEDLADHLIAPLLPDERP